MNKALFKELLSTIKINIKRFISLVLIIFLGVAFYVGMKSNAPVLMNTMIDYFNEYNYMDIQIIPPIGLTPEEMDELKSQVKDIELIEGGFQESVIIELMNQKINEVQKSTVLVNSYNETKKINKIMVVEGKTPTKENELMIDTSINKIGYNIGDKITIENENIKNKEFTIVGIIRSPEYISLDKDVSKLFNGEIDYFLYIPEENFDYDGVYNRGYIKINTEKKPFTKEYDNHIDKVVTKIEKLSHEIAKERKNEFIIDKQNEYQSKYDEYQQNKEKALSELEKVKNEIADGEEQVNKAKEEIMSDREIDLYLESLKIKLDSAKEELDSSKKALEAAEDMIDGMDESEIADIEYWQDRLLELQEDLSVAEQNIAKLEEEISGAEEGCLSMPPEDQQPCFMSIILLKESLSKLRQEASSVEDEIEQIENMIDYLDYVGSDMENAKYYLSEAQKEYNSSLTTYNNSLKDYNYAVKNLKTDMTKARVTLAEKEKELEKAKEELKTKEIEVNNKLLEAETELSKAKNKLNTLETISWYVFDRNYQTNYSQYYDDVMRIDNIAKVLPFVFFIVAALVTSSSISRLVKEERGKIGILKSLGYSNKKVLSKYIYYTGIAVFIGIILGLIFGIVVFPNIFATVYSLLYYIPSLKYSFEYTHIIIAIIFALLSTILVAYIVVRNTLVEQPYYLLRPKVERKTKKTILERNKKVWKKLSFMKKVTYRNIFRSIGKSVMTILGIAGCTALIITGFGIRAAFSEIIPEQYGNIFKLNSEVFFKNDITNIEVEEELKRVNELPEIDTTTIGMVKLVDFQISNNKKLQVNAIVPNDLKTFYKLVELNNVNDKKSSKLKLSNDGVILTGKIAKLLNAKVGGTISFTDEDNNTYKVKVAGICENYIYHYMYMTQEYYKEIFNIDPQNNLLMAKYYDGENEKDVNEKITSSRLYSNILSLADAERMYNNIMDKFNIVLIVIIICAALLAFVVLYNLAKINISERTKEIATLKVLGFNLKAVNRYINREVNILTIIGIIVGIIGGKFLTSLVINTCEIDSIMLSRNISLMAYIYGIILTIVFTFIINKAIKRDIKKIDMVESLKYIE